jgi:hypothetical protein
MYTNIVIDHHVNMSTPNSEGRFKIESTKHAGGTRKDVWCYDRIEKVEAGSNTNHVNMANVS